MILVAIPVHQRGNLARHCFSTVAELELPPGGEVVVFDDASPSLDVAALLKATQLSARLERLPSQIGADRMVAHIWRSFLDGPHERLLFIDSDMIANRDAVSVGLGFAAQFDGLLSLYNSTHHQGRERKGDLVSKASVGNAGTLWSRRLAQLALDEVGKMPGIDFAYSRLFDRLGIPISVTAQSRMQHLGVMGVNNRYFGTIDHGLGFVPDAPAQWRAIAVAYDELMRRQQHYLKPAPGLADWLPWRRR